MQDKLFPAPISIRLEAGRERLVRSAWEGLEVLSEWPARDGRSYRSAVRTCRDALDGLAPAHEARRALVVAAREAAILPSKDRRA
jgi:hypothetical protein